MSINLDYYVLNMPDRDDVPYLVPDDTTDSRPYTNTRLEPGPPLIFSNMWRQDNIDSNSKEKIGGILFSGSNILINAKIYREIKSIDLPSIYFYPAIYINDNNDWMEDYWFVTFLSKLDCWNRKTSGYYRDSGTRNGTFEVYHFDLDQEVLTNDVVHKNLIFKMGKTLSSDIFVHESLLSIFELAGDAVNLTRVDKYKS